MSDLEHAERHLYRAADGTPFWVLVVLDDDPQPPEFDGGCPVFEVGIREVTHTGYGNYYEPAHQERLRECFEAFVSERGRRKGIEIFERYVAIFHGGAIIECTGSQGPYVAVITQTLWEAWGNTGPVETDVVDIKEWSAYIDGDVYGYVLLQGENLCVCGDCRDIDSLPELGSCWGFYGDDGYAHEAGLEELRYFIRMHNESKETACLTLAS